MTYHIRFTRLAKEDLMRLYVFRLHTDHASAVDALEAITHGIDFLHRFPFSCRRIHHDSPFLRELIISFGSTGYVALFKIDDHHVVKILAIRHQHEDDYYT
ncbi:type II toxin-antitoxin system RelE/ParE family toxin [Pelodictyon luteolum]|uniref:type II toxin-antitoxin system RelE/ParE family toxin n=1 Tax=Pelodictyon luteolum TaxID=1100 RepID=UPI0002FC1162|nr:type II toxin-antitoxin system RelE/ParE family toxin [Pelodictyon luteolum]